MKNTFALLVALIGSLSISSAQRIALVNAEVILEGLEEYQSVLDQLDTIAIQWQKEIESEFDKIQTMYQEYAAEEVLLSEDMKKKKQEEIIERERKARELQRKKFGPDGELFTIRQRQIEPIQARVYSAIEAFAAEKDIDIIIDRNSSLGVMYSNDEYDITDQIVRKLKLQ